MLNREPLLRQILSRQTGANVSFSDLRRLLHRLGFTERISGSHHLFTKSGVTESINIQPSRGQVKPYQIQQVRRVFEKYSIGEQ
jgi:virulence-associated protein VapD